VRHLTLLAVAVVILTGLGVLSGVVTRGLARLDAARAEQRRLRLEKVELERDIARMEETLHRLETDPEAVESVTRRDLGWIRPGERIILLATPTPQPTPSVAGDTAEPLLTLRPAGHTP